MKTPSQLEVQEYCRENLKVDIICEEINDNGTIKKELTVKLYFGDLLISEDTTSI